MKTGHCKSLIIIFLVTLLLTLNNEPLITCQSISSNDSLFVYSSLVNGYYLIIHMKAWNKMNCELMLTYDTPAFRQTGSRNLTGQKTLSTIWGTYMKLVTKYQISANNSYWEKCDEKWAYMFNVNKKSTKSANRK